MSQRTLAGLAGLTQGYVSQLESGVRPLDRRSTQAAIAGALNISVAQLLGEPSADDPLLDRATTHVPAVRSALIELAAGERRTPTRDKDQLRTLVKEASELRNAASYAAIAPTLAELLLDVAGHGSDMKPELVELLFASQFTLRAMGLPDLGREAAELGIRVAEDIVEPHWRGTAWFSWVQAFPPESAALGARLTTREAAMLEHRSTRAALETRGRLHLLGALQAAACVDNGAATTHLDEATEIATHLGEPEPYGPMSAGVTASWFGPTQVDLWRVSIAAELGDTRTALSVADRIDLTLMPVPNRHVYFHLDSARALAAAGKDLEAMHALGRAERAAPQHFRFSSTSRELVSTLIQRARRRAVAGDLSRLATRLGIDVA